MYSETTKHFANIAVQKIDYLTSNFMGFLISAMMAGAYVGVGIVLVLTVATGADPASVKIIMGSLFGIALTLIVFAGAELFSGHTMFMAFGFLHKKVKALHVLYDWIIAWWGNLFGSMCLAILFALSGGIDWMYDAGSLVHTIADHKVNSTVVELLARGAICNWLICLAIWMAARTKNDMAKCIFIFWCLFAFIAAGFEHGVANMSVFTISLMGEHSADVNLYSVLYNLLCVSVGNIIGGAGFIGVAYFLTNKKA
jgi:nitrite transporter NirC